MEIHVRLLIQVNLCQKLFFLHQLTQNMMTDCSLNYNSKLKPGEWGQHVVYKNCFWHSVQVVTQHVFPMFCQKKSFWQRFTCMPKKLSGDGLNLRITIINELRQNLTNSEDSTVVLSLILKQACARFENWENLRQLLSGTDKSALVAKKVSWVPVG